MSYQIEREKRIAALASRSRCNTALSADKIARGAHLCWSNAVSLLADVRLLVAHERYARALSLTVLALEELAKPPLLWALNPEDDAKAWKTFWKEQFSRHGTKQEMISAYGAATGVRREPYWFELNSDSAKALDLLKQWGFYVDCVDARFQSPADFGSAEREITDLLFAFAEERADSFGLFHSSPESSLFTYEHRFKASRPSELWPPPVRSVNELQTVLLSVASEYSHPSSLHRDNFLDACTDLRSAAGKEMFHDALWATGGVCCMRARFKELPTAYNRAVYMLNVCLEAVAPSEQREALRQWDQGSSAG